MTKTKVLFRLAAVCLASSYAHGLLKAWCLSHGFMYYAAWAGDISTAALVIGGVVGLGCAAAAGIESERS